MDPKHTKILIGIALAVGVVVVIGLGMQFGGLGGGQKAVTNQPAPYSPQKTSTFNPTVPKNVEITKPVSETPITEGNTDNKLRSFNMTVGSAGYSPKEIVINVGDAVSLSLTAEGGTYDFHMPDLGISKTVKSGETGSIGFQIYTKGTYVFQCQDHCPGSKIQGKLIVL